MSRTARLLDLLQLLRNRTQPVTGPDLAAELGISIRTLYRDIVTLQAQGADVRGEPGLGYILHPGFTLPPLMFTTEEIEAIVLGSRWVAAGHGDARLSQSASQALSKITAVLPPELRERAEATNLLVARNRDTSGPADPAEIRSAIRNEQKLAITYRALDGSASRRVIWPFLIGFFDRVRIVAGWCELRQDFRNFRVDHITSIHVLDGRYPRRRAVMLKEWRAAQNIPPT
ncbi:MAG: Transcriptional regulator, DeoR family [Devosia sp.]|uniref:helix-turn-helix transcriptional regulator n=1 Tax=Devosia sp. TaxID=1871048 RepID=UPI0026273448|nr:YafY family protein [Devosia sp.]MDB5586900.1 Transcriptional regulator, DeoR family [Devosia sp.]